MNPLSVNHQQSAALQNLQSSQGTFPSVSEKGTSNFLGHSVRPLNSGSISPGVRQVAESFRQAQPSHSEPLKSSGRSFSLGTGPSEIVHLAQKILGRLSGKES